MMSGNSKLRCGPCQTRRAESTRKAFILFGAFFINTHCPAELDEDLNQLSDVWQRKYGVAALPANGDEDGDGFTNAQENRFGTDPSDTDSHPAVFHSSPAPGSIAASWHGERGKTYQIENSRNLFNWTLHSRQTGQGVMLSGNGSGELGQPFFLRVGASDPDTDGDGLTDWEEISTGFNPTRIFSEGLGSNPSNPTVNNPRITDKQLLAAALAAPTNTVTVSAADPSMSEAWPDPGRFVIRRSGNLKQIDVLFSYGGTASTGIDYTAPSAIVTLPFGADEATVEIIPLTDSQTESPETVTLTLLQSSDYTLGTSTTAKLDLADAPDGKPSVKPASRFLTQATFGPAPQELTRVTDLGYSTWIEEQFLRTPNLHLPIVQAWQAELQTPIITSGVLVGSESRIEAWWRQSMRADAASDPLRQRMAFALSQIFVISDRMESLNADQRGMTSYYDTLLTNAFGTYRQLLEAVTRHPWMGLYLSSIRNRKANALLNRFPDENYAREVLQLFSIGLWRLHPDGSHYLSNGSSLGPDGETIPAGQPVPTYGQSQISEIARVFTGMSYGMRFMSGTDPTEIPATSFSQNNNIPWQPMRMFDGEHDLSAKTINFPGMTPLTLPASTGTTSTSQTGGNADLTTFLDHLASHPNVAPFISRLLIQRLITSNPTPAYIGRVSTAFTNSGGDLKAVIRAILLDAEARHYSRLAVASHGLVREPYTRYIAMARALEAAPADPIASGGRYRGFGGLDGDFLQRPLSAPSVFNFYSPEHKPAGPLRDNGLNSPEMQIINSVTSIIGPNRYSDALSVRFTTLDDSLIPTNNGWTRLNISEQTDNTNTAENENLRNTRINEARWLDLAITSPSALAPDAMVARLDEMLCYGNMSQPTFRAITRSLSRQNDPFTPDITDLERDQRIRVRLRNAIHLITLSADYAVLK